MNTEREIIKALLQEIEQNTCTHEETHRGGAIWEICNECSRKWADDEGGKPEFKWSPGVLLARQYLSAKEDTKRLADLIKESGDKVRHACDDIDTGQVLIARLRGLSMFPMTTQSKILGEILMDVIHKVYGIK